jgi:hypothetical protein
VGIQGNLREIGRASGFSYPPSFMAGVDAFVALVASEDFCRGFGDARLFLSASEVAAACATVPDGLVPFMGQEQTSWIDIYAFDPNGERVECKVVVWADHAIVMDWESFPAFMHWLRERLN